MAIYITGDIHGKLQRFYPEIWTERYRLQPMVIGDIVIICGDFGLPWFNDERDKYYLDFLESQPATFLFIDGNHENFPLLYSFPVKEWHGGKVHVLRPNVLHLMRGEIFDIGGMRTLAFGGAYSIDRQARILDFSWWKEEIPSPEEWDNLRQHLQAVNYRVDLVLTHSAPMRFLQPHTKEIGIDWAFFADDVARGLSGIEPEINYRFWCFGHYHLDWIDREQSCSCLSTNIIQLK